MNTEDLLGDYIKKMILKELDVQLFTHAMSCDTTCDVSVDDCPIRIWLVEYRDMYKQENGL